MNDFGKLIRKTRLDVGETLSTMAKGLGKTVSFLSAIETGVKKIPMDIVPQIREYLVSKGADYNDLLQLEDYANVVNGSVKLDGIKPNQKEMMVMFARSDLSQEQLDLINEILTSKQGCTK